MTISTNLYLEERRPPARTPADAVEARRFIEEWASRTILGFEGTIDASGRYLSNIYRTASSLSEQIVADYHGRFLVELIQNAHDVHPEDRQDGRVEVLFDESAGEHGVLYVANGGRPFTDWNVESLSNLGLSSKPPGEAIGNKGLGFRSVRHVCDAPEIYSQADQQTETDRFSGFCFRFATDIDLAELTSSPLTLARALEDLPPFHVPVWLTLQSERVREFAARGFATVVALPLRDGRAAEAVSEEMEELRGLAVPVLMFLSRLQSLTLRSVDSGGVEDDPLVLTRCETPLPGAPSGLGVADLGPVGRYLVARRAVPETAMLDAIVDGIAGKQLHSQWSEWTGEGEVALAVRLGDEPAPTSRLFTYLPMGEQAYAPFQGYLHASFFPSPNRKVLNGKIRLNEMLLEEAADLAASSAAWLARAEGGAPTVLAPADRARAVVDLICWRLPEGFETTVDLPRRVVSEVARNMQVASFAEAAVAPVLAGGAPEPTWRPAGEARRWAYAGEVFSADVAARHGHAVGSWPIWPGLGGRADTLVACFRAFADGYSEGPKGVERAGLAEKVAGDLADGRGSGVKAWTAYYRELADFVGAGGTELADRPILLGDDGNLSHAMTATPQAVNARKRGRRRFLRTGQVAVFAPPARRGSDDGETDDLAPPKALAENFAFLSGRLDWYGELSEARSFLVRHKLILEFDRESILTQLARVLKEDTRKASRAAGLRWAFQIWRRPHTKGRGFTLPPNLRLYVPTLDNDFVAAEEAIFSDRWPEELRGRLIQRLLDAAPAGSADLARAARRRLAGPDHYAMKVGTPALWATFLQDLGVKRGLHPQTVALSGAHRGATLLGAAFWRTHGLSDTAHARWMQAVASRNPAVLSPNSTYFVGGDLRWMPGQWDLAEFDREAIESFALLVIAWLGESLPEEWGLTIRHSTFSQADRRVWPSPLEILLREMAWIPAQEPTADGAKLVVVSPDRIWMAADGGDRFPAYLRRPTVPVMRALERAGGPHMAAIRAHTRLRTFDRSDSLLAQAAFLAEQFANPGFDPFFERHLANLYAGTWQSIADHYRHAPFPPAAEAPELLLARRGGALEVFRMRGPHPAEEPIYVRDSDDETAASLVDAAGRPMLEVRGGDRARFGQVLKTFYGDGVRLLSETQYSVSIDGHEVGTGPLETALQWCPHLPLMLAVAMEGLKGPEARNLPANRQIVLDRLRHVRIQSGVALGFRLDEHARDRLEDGPDALSLKLPDGRALVVARTGGTTGWGQLDGALAALCDALGVPGAELGLRLLLRSMDAADLGMRDDPDFGRDLDLLCGSLRLTERARRAVRESLGAGLDRYMPWLRALVFMGGGQTALDEFRSMEADAVQDVVALRAAIAPWLAPLNCEAQTVVDACRLVLGIGELREALKLDFEALNEALVAVGQRPDTYEDVHARQLANRIRTLGIDIVDALREVAGPALDAGDPAPDYAAARDAVPAISPDPAWLLRYREVPDALLDARIDEWLASQGASPLGAPRAALEPLEEVRRTNAAELKQLVAVAAPLVRAWCGARGEPTLRPWSDSDSGFGELRALLDGAGVMDYRELDVLALHVWLERLGKWPAGMKRTLDRNALQLGETAVAAARALADAEAAARRKQARSIEFNGSLRDPEEADWQLLDAELAGSLPRSLLRTPLGQPAQLAPARSKSDGSRAVGSSGGAGGQTFVPSAKTEMIGRLGELAVRHWLQARLPKQDIAAGWLSGNAGLFTGREGDDGLGYDFEVSWQRQTWQIEVKASLNDPRTFQLGETEVRAGRAAARARSGVQYWIACVSNLASPASARIDLIPNPLSEAGEAVLELAGEGLRYRFRRA